MNKNYSTIVAAIDIGTTKVCAIIAGRNEHGKIEVLGIGKADSHGVMRGVISNIDKTVQAIEEAVTEAKRKAGSIEVKNVYAGVAGQHIKSMRYRGYMMRDHNSPEISQYDIERLVADMHKTVLPPGDEIIHVLPQEFIVDSESGIKDPIGMAGIKLEADFHIITGQATAIRNIYRCIEKAGLRLVGLILEPLASASAVLNAEELEAGVALVDIGGGTTDIAIFHEGIIRHTCVIPLGGTIITEDIREGCMVMREQAEKLKVKFGSALAAQAMDNAVVTIPTLREREPKEISLKNLAHIIQARVEEIIEHVYYEIRVSGYESKLIGGIVITGGGARLKHINLLSEFITGLDARIGSPTEHLSNGRSELNDPLYATAIGLAIKALENPVATAEIPKEATTQHNTEAQNNNYSSSSTNNNNPNTSGNSTNDDYNSDDIFEKETPHKGTSWFDNLLRKSREWLEGDVSDFK